VAKVIAPRGNHRWKRGARRRCGGGGVLNSSGDSPEDTEEGQIDDFYTLR